MQRGDVYWVDFEAARGGEIKKIRPAVIVSNDAACQAQNRLQVIPLTSNVSRVRPWQALVTVGDKPAKALADQIRTVSKERLTNREGTVSRQELVAVEQAIKVQLGLT